MNDMPVQVYYALPQTQVMVHNPLNPGCVSNCFWSNPSSPYIVGFLLIGILFLLNRSKSLRKRVVMKSFGIASIVSAIVVSGFTMTCGTCSYQNLPYIVTGVFGSFFMISYLFSTQIMKLLYRPVKAKGKLLKLMEKETKSIGIKKPGLYIFHNIKPIAFSVNSLEKAVFLSTGILKKLNEYELRGVLLHELYHLKSKWGGIKRVLYSLKRSTLFDIVFPIPMYELDQLQEKEIDGILMKKHGIDTNLIRKKLT